MPLVMHVRGLRKYYSDGKTSIPHGQMISAGHRSSMPLGKEMREWSASTLSQSGNPQYDFRHRLVEIAAALPFWVMSPMAAVLRHHPL